MIQWTKEVDDTRILTIGSNAVKGAVGNANNEHIQIANQLTEVGGASGTNYSKGIVTIVCIEPIQMEFIWF